MPVSRESTIDVTHGDLKLHCTRIRITCGFPSRGTARRGSGHRRGWVLQASLSANSNAHAVSVLTRTRRGIGNSTRVYLGCAGTCFFLSQKRHQPRSGRANHAMQAATATIRQRVVLACCSTPWVPRGCCVECTRRRDTASARQRMQRQALGLQLFRLAALLEGLLRLARDPMSSCLLSRDSDSSAALCSAIPCLM